MLPKKDDAPDKRRYLSSAARKEEILDAALVEFADRTYNAVSMERLAECAGLSKAGIYAHFKSKEEIFHALLERTTKQICDFQGWLPDEDLTLPELVDVYLDRLYATFSRPLKKWASNASGTLFSKKRVAQTRLRSDCTGQSGLFAGHLAHFGRTYPRAHA